MLAELINIFEAANDEMISRDRYLLKNKVSERTLCGALMLCLSELIKTSNFQDYYVDVEYNRNYGEEIKAIENNDLRVIHITCDLIVHSRGHNERQDNLIAIEMKKSTRSKSHKNADKERLMKLTKTADETPDGNCISEYVYGYVLGIYYEIKFRRRTIPLEYYRNGQLHDKKNLYYSLS